MVVTQSRADDPVRMHVLDGREMDQILPANFLDSMAKHTVAECGIEEYCICLENLDPDTAVVQLPCKHTFHRGCAEKWLTRCPTFRFAKCPTCRQQLRKPSAQYPVIPGANNVATVGVPQS